MATYTKKLKTLEIHQAFTGETATPITDTAADDVATRMLNEFKNYGTMHVATGGMEVSVPYHAVQYIKVTETDGSIEKADPYGCDE